MPQIVALLQDNDKYTRGIGANLLSQLSEQCKIFVIWLPGNADLNL